jgi:hypothetical protein
VLTFGNTPIFGGFVGLTDGGACGIGGGPGCASLIVRGLIGGTPQPGAVLQIRATGFASDIINNPFFGATTFSSDFAPQFNRVASNTRVVVQGGGSIGGGSTLSPGVNNASGSPETNTLAVKVQGIRTRDDQPGFTGNPSRDALPGDREFVVGIVNLCEAGVPVNDQAVILPPVAAATPSIAGGLASLPCIPSGTFDGNPTQIVGLRIAVSGTGAQWVQSVRAYADLEAQAGAATGWAFPGLGGAGGVFFEAGEQILNQIPVNGLAQIGSLRQTLTTTGGTPLLIADGAGAPLPALLYFTVDIDNRATSSDVTFEVAIDVADVPGSGATSRLANARPLKFTFHIAGPAAPPPPGPTTATLVANVGKAPKKPAKSMTYKDVFVSATGPAGASKALTGFSVPGCTVKSVKGPALPVTVSVGGAPVGPFKVKVKCATKPAAVPGLTPLRVGGGETDGVPSLIPLRAGSVGTVEVFTLTGKKVLETGFSGGALDATKLDLPNGVYLYVVTVQTPEGIVRSELRKLVIKH